jgi:hypothetical protein
MIHLFSITTPNLSLADNAFDSSDMCFIDIGCPYSERFLHNAVKHQHNYVLLAPDKKKATAVEERLEKEAKFIQKTYTNYRVKPVDWKRVFLITEGKMRQPIEQEVYEKLIKLVFNIIRRQVFLCYAREDKMFSDRLAISLSESTIPVWYAPWELNVGDSIVDRINEGIRGSSYLCVVLSPASVEKDWCRQELNAALNMKLKNRGIQILPVLYRDCEIPPLFLDTFFADFRESFDKGMFQLLRRLMFR